MPVIGSPVAFTLNGRPVTASPAAVWQPVNIALPTYGYTFQRSGGRGVGPAPAPQSAPAIFFGTGLQARDRVTVVINGVQCSTATVAPTGEWLLYIHAFSPCRPVAGSAVTFLLNGQPVQASPAAIWQPGGTPPGTTGYALGVGTGTPTADGQPATFYGASLAPGATVAASIGAAICATTTANAAGDWSLSVAPGAACLPTAGATVSFTVNGALALATPPAATPW